MAIPVAQMVTVARYVLKQRLAGRERYPLVLMLEPLFLQFLMGKRDFECTPW